MHVPQEGLAKAMFPVFLEKSACVLSNAWVSFFKLCKENMNDVSGFLNSSGGLGEDPTLFDWPNVQCSMTN